jgi:hypothetical protein
MIQALLGFADQCLLGNVYLRPNLSRNFEDASSSSADVRVEWLGRFAGCLNGPYKGQSQTTPTIRLHNQTASQL